MTGPGAAALCSALIWASTGCTAAASPWFRAESGVEPAQVDLSALAARPGAHEYHLSVRELGERSLDVWLPPSGKPKLLVTFLHGAVARQRGKRFGSEGMTHELLRCLVIPSLGAFEPLVIAPRSADGEWWNAPETQLVLGLADAARRRFPSVEDRHVVVGYSNGGIAAWYFARLYPEHFSAAIAIAGNATIVGASPLPVYTIHGTHDEMFPIAGVRRAVRALEQEQRDVRLVEKYRGGHYSPCTYAEELGRAADWLQQRGLAAH